MSAPGPAWQRRGLLTAGVGVVAAMAYARSATAAPNPFGDITRETDVTLDATGGWQAVERQRVELRLAYEVGWTLAFPDAIRLPDELGRPLPGLLGLAVGAVSGGLDGATDQVQLQQVGRRVAFVIEKRQAEVGVHELTIRHARTGASLVAGDGVHTFLQVGQSTRTTITGPGVLGVAEQRRPGVFVPVGTATDAGWIVPDGEGVHRQVPRVLRVEREPMSLAPPEISYS